MARSRYRSWRAIGNGAEVSAGCREQEQMDSSGYRSDGVGLAVAIVNAVYGTDSEADDGELLEKSLHEYGVMNRALSAREKAGLRGWAGHLHNVFAATARARVRTCSTSCSTSWSPIRT
jgi:hypothetical protein